MSAAGSSRPSGSASRSADLARHRDVRDACLHELLAEGSESVASVERSRVRLRVQDDPFHAALPRASHERVEDSATDPLPAPRREHGHAADVAVREQAPRTECPTLAVAGERVIGALIPFVALDLGRYALLDDEHRVADAHRLGLRVGPGENPNRHSAHRREG